MNAQTDQQLLRDYVEKRSEPAFAELVHRHIDLVHSAALRRVGDVHQAQDVTQGTFVALAQNAAQLTQHPVLSGWLHRTTQNIAANLVRANVRRQSREQEAVTMNELLSAAPDGRWETIAPHLDAALDDLDPADRDAVLLRYFEKKSAPEMAAQLGINVEAAQKRVSRAVERLREIFAKRGVTVGASGLVVVISANAVQAAPVGLALTVSTAAALTGTTIATTATATATKAIAMTALQKTIVAATIAVVAGVGIYEARQAAHLRQQVQTLQQERAPLTEQLQALLGEQTDLKSRLTAVTEENEQLKSGQKLAELLKLRGDMKLLQSENERLAQLFESEFNQPEKDLMEVQAKRWVKNMKKLKEKLAQLPEKDIPELKLLSDKTWLDIARNANVDSEEGLNEAFARLRKIAKEDFAKRLSRALRDYARANGNQLPPDTLALKSYFASPVDETTLARYELLRSGELKSDEALITEKAAVDARFDTLFKIGANGFWFNDVSAYLFGGGTHSWTVNDMPLNVQAQAEAESRKRQEDEKARLIHEAERAAEDRDGRILNRALQEFKAAHSGQEPENPSEMIPYLRTSVERAAYARLKQRNGF